MITINFPLDFWKLRLEQLWKFVKSGFALKYLSSTKHIFHFPWKSKYEKFHSKDNFFQVKLFYNFQNSRNLLHVIISSSRNLKETVTYCKALNQYLSHLHVATFFRVFALCRKKTYWGKITTKWKYFPRKLPTETCPSNFSFYMNSCEYTATAEFSAAFILTTICG